MSEEDYPDAGWGSPASIEGAIAEYLTLPEAMQQMIPMIVWLMPSGTPDYKMPNDLAEYTDYSHYPDDQRCDNCVAWYIHGLSRGNLCSWLRDGIALSGWCRFWHQDPEDFTVALLNYVDEM